VYLAAGEGLQPPPKAFSLDFIDDGLWQAQGSGVKAIVKKTVVVVFRRAVVRRPDALTGFVVDLCELDLDGPLRGPHLLWCSNLSDASTWAASGGHRSQWRHLSAMSSPRLRLSRDDFTPHAKQLVQCALGYF